MLEQHPGGLGLYYSDFTGLERLCKIKNPIIYNWILMKWISNEINKT